MKNNSIDREEIERLLPHRAPMLLIDKLIDIVPSKSATAILTVRKNSIIVEAFGQAAAALTAHSVDPKETKDKLVYLMSVDKARFRNPIIPDCELNLYIKAIRSHGRVWKYKGVAKVGDKKMAEAEWSATVIDRVK